MACADSHLTFELDWLSFNEDLWASRSLMNGPNFQRLDDLCESFIDFEGVYRECH